MTDFMFSDKGFEKIIDALKKDGPTARVGILGNSNTRANAESTNAAIGIKHELGIGLPIRSFLKMPISTQLQKEMESSNIVNQKTVGDVIKMGSLLPIVKKLAILGERCVLLAFDSGGFGQWRPSNMKYKKVHQTLIETQQLRNSITSEVI